MPGAEPLFHRGGRRGVLLLHGFLGSPFEMQCPARSLIDAGFTVSVPRLPGHGTSLEDMARTSAADWLGAARESYEEITALCDDVSIAGLSMGGIIALLLAAEFRPRKLVIISTPRRIPDRRAYLAPLVRPFVKILPRRDEEKGLLDPAAREVHVCYSEGVPVMGAWHLAMLIRRAMKSLPRVHADTLIMQSRNDRMIPPDSMEFIKSRIASAHVATLLLERGGHTVTADAGREEVAAAIRDFTGE